MKALLLIALALAGTAAAQTQTRSAQVYRCGADGRDLRDSPCPSGPGASSAVSYDQPSAADSRAARERQQADSKTAAALASARRASEAEARRNAPKAITMSTLPPPAQPASAPKAKPVKAPKPPKPPKVKPASAPASGR